MIRHVAEIGPGARSGFDQIIDVRSPGEFAIDHVPGAINLPVLDNDQRAEVGTIYVQGSKFVARRVGAAHVSRNIAAHLSGPLADKPGSYTPLIYCWRGGQRSNAMATVLDQVGWRVTLLDGGYKTYRRRVTAGLYDADLPWRLVLLDGGTGCGKTEMLALLTSRGLQALDLEGLAEHRGSLFGARPGRPQPSQKLFESRLLSVLETFDPERPVVVEAESSKVGDLYLPPALWAAMSCAPRIVLRAPASARADYLVRAYPDLVADPAVLMSALLRLPPHHSREQVEAWRALAGAGEFVALAAGLIEAHYDPAYARTASAGSEGGVIGVVDLDSLDGASLERAADQAAALIASSLRTQTR